MDNNYFISLQGEEFAEAVRDVLIKAENENKAVVYKLPSDTEYGDTLTNVYFSYCNTFDDDGYKGFSIQGGSDNFTQMFLYFIKENTEIFGTIINDYEDESTVVEFYVRGEDNMVKSCLSTIESIYETLADAIFNE